MAIEPLKLPSEFICPQCQTRLDLHSPITKQAADRGVEKGLVLVCGHCSCFCVVGDSSLDRLTVKQFKGLGVEMQRLLGLTRMQIEKRNAKGRN